MESTFAQRSLERLGRGVGVLPAGVNRAAAVVVLIMLAAAAATIAWRRLAGALVNPLNPAALLAVGVLTAAAAAAVRIGWFRGTRSRSERAVMVVTSLAAVVLLAALCPGTPPAWIVAVGFFLAAEESWAWIESIRRRADRTRGEFSGRRHVGPVIPFRADVPSAAKRSLAPLDAMPTEEVTQQLVRSRAADGSEVLSGWLRTYFAAGQRTGSVHVAFCPPLENAPEVVVEQIDGPQSRIRTAQVLPYGVRLDLKLAAAAPAPTGVLLQFSARSAREK